MTGREEALCLFAVLAVACVAGLAWVLRSYLKGRAASAAAVAVTGAAVLCGFCAAYGWAWFLATGMLR